MLLSLLLTASMTLQYCFYCCYQPLSASLAPHMLFLLLLTAYLALQPVSAVVNSLPVPSTVAPVFNSLPCPNRTVSPVANSPPGPSNTVAPLLTALWPLQCCYPCFTSLSVPSCTATQCC